MIRTHAIRAILIGSATVAIDGDLVFINNKPVVIGSDTRLIGDTGLKRIRFANISTEAIDDYTIVSMGFANINAAAIADP